MIQSFKKQVSTLIVIFFILNEQISSTNPYTLESAIISRHAWANKASIELICSPGAGMFSGVTCLLGALEIYENGLASGVEVAYGRDGVKGLYYDETKGANWWEYYYEPLSVGLRKDNNAVLTINGNDNYHFSSIAVYKMGRKRAHYLLSTYVHIKEQIQKFTNEFINEKFNSKSVIGVHYRGTDKSKEAPRISYEKFIRAIRKVISKLRTEDFQIFVATDEQPFLNYIVQLFPGKVISYEGITRSTDGKPVHFDTLTPYKAGEDALIDCLLLSRCNAIVRTESNLSLVATFFNPDIPVVLVK